MDARRKRVMVNLSDSEFEELRSAARGDGRSVSAYARLLMLRDRGISARPVAVERAVRPATAEPGLTTDRKRRAKLAGQSKPKAGKRRTEMCEHRNPSEVYCARCDG